MRVLVAPAHDALLDVGSEYHLVYDLLIHLAKEPHIEIDVVTGCVDPQLSFPSNVHLHPLLPFKTTITLGDRIKMIWLSYWKARTLIRQHRYDLIHHIRPYKLDVSFSLLSLLGLTRNIPFVIGSIPAPQGQQFADDWLFLFGQTDPNTPWWKKMIGYFHIAWISVAMKMVRWLSSRTLHAADAIVGASEDAQQAILQRVPHKRVVSIPCGVTMALQPKSSYVAQPPFRILGIGYFVKRKNFASLIRIFSRVAAQTTNVTLDLVGFGPEEDALKKLVEDLGITDKVRFRGSVSHRDVAKYYREADLYCSTSLSETDVAPSCLEAMATGLPIVVMDTPGFRPLVHHEKTGLLFPQGAETACAEAVSHLIAHQSKREALGKEAFRLLQSEYVWPVAAAKYLALYREVTHAR